MNDSNIPPAYPAQTPQRPSGGSGTCLLKGCLIVTVIVMLLGIGVGALGWYIFHGAQPFFSREPVAIRTFQGGEAAYNDTQAKLDGFSRTVAAGQPATMTLTADDLNALVAHDSRFAEVRNRLFLSIVNNQLVAETSFPLNEERSASRDQRLFFNARVVLDASYSSGDFTFLLARFETLNGHQPSPTLMKMVRSYVTTINLAFNRAFHEHPENNEELRQVTDQLRTVLIKDNQVIATSVEHPKPAATPTPAPGLSPVAATPEP